MKEAPMDVTAIAQDWVGRYLTLLAHNPSGFIETPEQGVIENVVVHPDHVLVTVEGVFGTYLPRIPTGGLRVARGSTIYVTLMQNSDACVLVCAIASSGQVNVRLNKGEADLIVRELHGSHA